MKWRLPLVFFALLVTTCVASEPKIIKVLPHLVDKKGRHALSPSLYDRDAYQVYLREHPAEITALRFDVQWKAGGRTTPLKLKIEIRGSKLDLGTTMTVQTEVEPPKFFAKWSQVSLDKETHDKLGEII